MKSDFNIFIEKSGNIRKVNGRFNIFKESGEKNRITGKRKEADSFREPASLVRGESGILAKE
jgi:hypothetical protein